MQRSLNLFNTIIQNTAQITSLYDYIKDYVKPPHEYSDLLRWQWTQSVSALDKLIHDLIRIGMIESFQGKRTSTKDFLNFQVNLKTHLEIIATPNNSLVLFESQVTNKHKFLTFQDPDKISKGLSLIWNEEHKWQKISQTVNLDEQHVKVKLKNISLRRNQIVHEGDYIILERQNIEQSDVVDVIDFISKIGNALATCILNSNKL